MKSIVSTAIAALFLTPLLSAHATECYVPQRGSAASICTDPVNCATQSGIFRIVLLNRDARLFERRLVISGTFQGQITNPMAADACGLGVPGITLNHTLVDHSAGGSIQTKGDVGCVIGGDGVTTLQVVETLNLDQGTGSYAGLVSGGRVVLTGTLGLETGINTFSVTGGQGEVCFH
jgi:hypothetical protein